MRKPLLILTLVSVGIGTSASAAESADGLYQGARKAYHSLKGDAARRKRRDSWLMVAHKFEAVATRFPRSERAPEALFTAAQLLEELSHISFVPEDLEASLADYRRLVEGHSRHRLADDGALALAKAELERQNQPEAARKTLVHALRELPPGDRHRQLKDLLASLPPEPSSRSLAKHVPLRVVASTKHEPSKPRSASHLAAETEAPSEIDSDAEEATGSPAGTVEEPQVNSEVTPTTAVESVEARARVRQLAKRNDKEVTLSEQLGLKVRRVVIDAGHGGHDAGATGPGGTKEKDVSLAIAKRLRRELEAQGLEVLLTREDDHFVRLEDRAKLANDAKGDLFISLHCNSAGQKSLHGIETYTLNTASDHYSIRLAARENSSTERGISDLQFILADLATKANTDESARLAARVQRGLVSRISSRYGNVRDLGNKQALFYVLLGAKMPAILVESSFLSNAEEEKRLSSKDYQEEVAQAIASGVQEFLGNRERLAKVD